MIIVVIDKLTKKLQYIQFNNDKTNYQGQKIKDFKSSQGP